MGAGIAALEINASQQRVGGGCSEAWHDTGPKSWGEGCGGGLGWEWGLFFCLFARHIFLATMFLDVSPPDTMKKRKYANGMICYECPMFERGYPQMLLSWTDNFLQSTGSSICPSLYRASFIISKRRMILSIHRTLSLCLGHVAFVIVRSVFLITSWFPLKSQGSRCSPLSSWTTVHIVPWVKRHVLLGGDTLARAWPCILPRAAHSQCTHACQTASPPAHAQPQA